MKTIDTINSPTGKNLLDATEANAGPTPFVLDAALVRAPVFLGALGTNPDLRAAMAQVGYTDAVHAQGWKLFFLANGGESVGMAATPTDDDRAAMAVAAIETWEEGGFVRARSALEHLHPDAAQLVFGGGLTSASGYAAIGPMATFLDRLDALESSPQRKSTRKADHAALATLAERGIDARLRKQLRALIVQASMEARPKPAPVPEGAPQRREALLGLYRWLVDWTDTARVVFKKQRAALITLSLAKRQPRKAKATTPPAVKPPAVTPPPPAPVAIPPTPIEEEPAPPSRAA